MKHTLALATVVLTLAGTALAQTPSGQSGLSTSVISPGDSAVSETTTPSVNDQQRAKIKALAPSDAPGTPSIAKGATIRADVELREFPPEVGLPQYRYVVVDRKSTRLNSS